MNALILLLVSSFVSSAYVVQCPDLAGSFQCTEKDEKGQDTIYTVQISQETKSGVTTYLAIDEDGEETTYIADGIARESVIDDSGFFIFQRAKTSCVNAKLSIDNNYKAAMDEKFTNPFAKIDVVSTFTPVATGFTAKSVTTTWQKDLETGKEKSDVSTAIDNCKKL